MLIKVWVKVGLVGCDKESEIEVPDEELAGLDEEAKNKLCEEYARDVLVEMYEWGWMEAK